MHKSELKDYDDSRLAHTLAYCIGQRIQAQTYVTWLTAQAQIATFSGRHIDSEKHMQAAKAHLDRIEEQNDWIADCEAEKTKRLVKE